MYDKREICSAQAGLRFAPRVTVLTALLALCAVYLLFLSLQAKYLFGAFWGALPEGFTYSGYARQGFFELCRVAAINIAILILANILSSAQAGQCRALRLCNLALSVLTLLLLATAASKMALYIAAMGLTVKRVLVSVFLVWMALVFICVIVRQFRPVPLVRAAAFAGAVLFALLCVLPVENGIRAYNRAYAPVEAAPEVAADGEILTVAHGDYAALEWQGRTYVPYCPADPAARGYLVGSTGDGDLREDYYTYQNYSSREWLLAWPRTGLMDAAMLYREENTWDIPAGLVSEYAWNRGEAGEEG